MRFHDRRRRDEALGLDQWLNSVVFYYNVMLTGVFLWGISAVLFSEYPNAVSLTVWPWLYPVWVWLHICAPISAAMGQRLLARSRREGDSNREWFGWRLCLGSDIVIFLMLLIHATALFVVDIPNDPIFLREFIIGLLAYFKFFVVGIGVCALGLSVRDYLKGRKCRAES